MKKRNNESKYERGALSKQTTIVWLVTRAALEHYPKNRPPKSLKCKFFEYLSNINALRGLSAVSPGGGIFSTMASSISAIPIPSYSIKFTSVKQQQSIIQVYMKDQKRTNITRQSVCIDLPNFICVRFKYFLG